MSILRKAAENIAAAVVRNASAGSREWAEAIQSELTYIASLACVCLGAQRCARPAKLSANAATDARRSRCRRTKARQPQITCSQRSLVRSKPAPAVDTV